MAVQQQCIGQIVFFHRGFFPFGLPEYDYFVDQLYVEPIRKEWPACLLSIAATPDPPSTHKPNSSKRISPPAPKLAPNVPSVLRSAVGLNESRINKITGDHDGYWTFVASPASPPPPPHHHRQPQPSYREEAQEGIDEIISPKLDEEMEIEPPGFVDNRDYASMEYSVTLEDTSATKSDQVPVLSGVMTEKAIFDGTYSTVFRGFYGHHEVCFSDSYVLGLTIPRWLSR
jgi:hypothetical protein